MAAEAKSLELRYKNAENKNLLQLAVADESYAKFQKISAGLDRFLKLSSEDVRVYYTTKHKVIWKSGSSRLLDYSNDEYKGGAVVLFVPSLINRHYIFDISHKRSMMRFMSDKGMRPLLLDWGEPSEEENNFSIGDYIKLRLDEAITYASEKFDSQVVIAGYCMGGLMALASAIDNKSSVKGLVLLATPWDFHSNDIPQIQMKKTFEEMFKELIESDEIQHKGVLSGSLIHQLLYFFGSHGLWAVHDRYARFSDMDLHSEEAKIFVERENWLHDNVSLTSKVAKECFIDWGLYNSTKKKKWKVAGKVVNPEFLGVPALISIANNDKIVPPLCTEVLTKLIPDSTVIKQNTGHIGTIVATNAEKHLWLPIEKWIRKL